MDRVPNHPPSLRADRPQSGHLISLSLSLFFFFWGGRGRGRERISSRLHTGCGTWSHNGEITTWAEIKSLMLKRNQLSHPGALRLFNPLTVPRLYYVIHQVGVIMSHRVVIRIKWSAICKELNNQNIEIHVVIGHREALENTARWHLCLLL